MSSFAPPWALAAEAMDALGDTHLAAGVHVRALPSPLIGVPATPLVIERAIFTSDLTSRLTLHTEVTWIDSQRRVLTMPFQVTPDNPVTGYLPSSECILAVLQARPGSVSPPTDPALTFEGIANSGQGPGVLMRRSSASWTVYGQRIDQVRVIGSGTVTGLRWVAREQAAAVAPWQPWRLWSLPYPETTPRYTPIAGAVDEAKKRVQRGAPTHQPMYVAYGAAAPAAAPPATPADAVNRVMQVADDLGKWLKRLLTDLSQPTWALLDQQTIAPRPDGTGKGQASLPIEPHLLASAVDPDCGHWLGFGDVDQELSGNPSPPTGVQVGTIVLYRVRALWRFIDSVKDRPDDAALLGQLVPFFRASRKDAVAAWKALETFKIVPAQEGQFWDLSALTAVVLGYVPDLPRAPLVDSTEDRGWLPEPPPPDVRRIVRLRASRFVPRALVAFAANDARGDRPLNPYPGVGRLSPGQAPPAGKTPLPSVVARPPDASGPGQGRFDDRDAPEGPVTYRLAQSDWFGRWGSWGTQAVAKKSRTAPLAPAVELLYAPPTFPAGPLPTTPAAGTLTVRVPLVRVADLPPGGYRLTKLEVTTTVDVGSSSPPPSSTTTSYTLGALPAGVSIEPHPDAHDLLVIPLPGPAIARAGFRNVRVVARWLDEGNLASPLSPNADRKLVDPRPPPLPPIDTELKYSARPDVTGWARVELKWTSTPGTRYRVFVSNETTLIAALAAQGRTDVVAAILQAAPGAPRAGVFRSNKALFGWDAFESVNPTPLVATGTQTTFVHRLSGSLDVLAIYRVLAEGESGVLNEMTEAEVVPFAVPNLGPPAQPLVTVDRAPRSPGAPAENYETDGVSLRVKVPRGRALPIAWRLRRASAPVRDGLAMDVVATGIIPATATTAAGTEFSILAAPPLKRWRQYRFAVEVQAGPPAGAPTVGPVPAGEWSQASALATVAVVPPTPPDAPSQVTAAAVAGGTQLTITHPGAKQIVGTAYGAYRFELVRQSPGDRPKTVPLDVQRSGPTSFVAIDAGAPTGSRWSVRVIDPLGRPSAPIFSNQV